MRFGKCMGTPGGRLYKVWEVSRDTRGHRSCLYEISEVFWGPQGGHRGYF